MGRLITRVFQFYLQGFRSMTLGRTLWKIILVKLLVIFAVIRLFFCPDYLQTRYSTDVERADHVFAVITNPASGGLHEASGTAAIGPPSH